MNYSDKKILLTGKSGFIGSALAAALETAGARVLYFGGDVRDKLIEGVIDHSFDYVFHFAAPSSQVLFKQNPDYCVDTTINSFLNISRVCRANGVKLIYPSTGLLSQGVENEYARCKKILEDIHLGSNLDALGIRIFAGFGVGEAHKRDYASVPYLFVRDVVEGKQPVVFGSGKQSRDFIYIDDLVTAILVLAEEATEKIVDVGSGVPTRFLDILEQIQIHSLPGMIDVKPIFVEAPENYIKETMADTKILKKYNCLPKLSFVSGLKRIMTYEKGNRNNNN